MALRLFLSLSQKIKALKLFIGIKISLPRKLGHRQA
jgi:hypothetical protein